MAEFDPDAYLAAKPATAFDPDAYLHGQTPPKYGMLESGLEGAQSGAAAGWRDELSGLKAAAGLPGQAVEAAAAGLGPASAIANPAAAIAQHGIGAARLAYEHATGQRGPATEAYERTRDEIRAREAQMKLEHPYAYGTGELGGAAASMLVAPEAGAAGWGARLAQGAKVGAGYGAASGAGEANGDMLDRLLKGGEGAVTGAIGGMAGTALGAGVEKAGRLAYDYLGRPVVSLARGLMNSEQEAMRRGAGALTSDYAQIQQGKALGLTPAEYMEAYTRGEPVTLADMGAEKTRALLRSAANTSPEGRNLITTGVNERFEGQAERVASDIRNLAGGNVNALKTRDQLRAEYDASRGGAYNAAYEAGDRQIWSPELERLTGAPYVQSALGSAISKWKNYAVLDGFGAMNPPFMVENGVLKNTGGSMKVFPNLQLWDYAARELQDAARSAPIGSQTASLYNGLARALKTELDGMVPQYKAARGIAADFFGGNNALEAGQIAAKFRGDPNIIKQQMAKMKPEERGMFQEGYADAKANDVLNMADSRDVTKRLYNSPNDRARMAAVFGQAALGPIETRLRLERIMDMARTALGNSTTARQLIEAGLAGGGIGAYLDGWRGALEGGLGAASLRAGSPMARAGAQKLIGYVDQNTARKVAEFLTSSDPALLHRGLQLASKNSRVTQGLKVLEHNLLMAGGTEGTGAMAASTIPQITVHPRAIVGGPGPAPASADEQQRKRGGRLEAKPDQGEGGEAHRANGGRVDANNIDHAPTEAQKKAGNYAKDHVHIHGLDITIENAKGAMRSGVDRGGKPWSVKMPAAYGYIKGTVGRDKDHVDVYIGSHPKSPHAFVVDQIDADSGKFDEHKAFLGFASVAQAKRAYLAAFSDGKGRARLGHMAEMSVDTFKRWLDGGDTTKRIEGAEHDHKLPHKAVGYIAKSRLPHKHCSVCSMFRDGPHCTLVRDPILPGAWCRRFNPKG